MAENLLSAKVNDLLLNYVQAYVNWLAHSESPAAFQDNQQMVVIQAELNRREKMRERLIEENSRLKQQLTECMEQLDPYGDDDTEPDTPGDYYGVGNPNRE